jgi:uncharacterized NAD(P)/FAD-binding protein YdhS
MSANSREPLEFLSFAQQRIPRATAEDFLPRTLYGEYLEATLLAGELSAPSHIRLDRMRGDVCAIEKIDGGSSLRVQLADGRSLVADDLVLAPGNPAPAPLSGTEALRGSAHYVEDPWSVPLAFRPGETVLMVGTGLTMADTATAAAASSKDQIVIHAISRHGLVPPSQTAFRHAACETDSSAFLREASFSARCLVRATRELAEDVQQRGGDWREVVTFVRGIAPALWQRLPMRERRRFLRHVRSYWDIHRHRLPQQTLAQLEQLRLREKLYIHAGRLLAFELVGEQVRTTWRPRGADETATLLVDRVVNCTGPDYNPRRSREPLMRSLLSQGLAVSDALGLGLRTGPDGAVLDSRGRAVSNVYYIGPMLRADHWEATAAQELRGHAERLASHLIASSGQLRASHGA